jgi:hypothetical protein
VNSNEGGIFDLLREHPKLRGLWKMWVLGEPPWGCVYDSAALVATWPDFRGREGGLTREAVHWERVRSGCDRSGRDGKPT